MRYPRRVPLLFTMQLISAGRSTLARRHHNSCLPRKSIANHQTSAFLYQPRYHHASTVNRRLPPVASWLSLSAKCSPTRLFSTTERPTTMADVLATNNKNNLLLDPYEILRELPINQNLPEQDNGAPPKIPLPTHLSPTSLESFSKCPQNFFFQYILKLKPDPPVTPQLARGIICHTALEEVFDVHPNERSLETLENLFRTEWGRLRGNREEHNAMLLESTNDGDGNEEDHDVSKVSAGTAKTGKGKDYDVLFRSDCDDDTGPLSYDISAEIDWGKSALDLLQNYYQLEDPKTISQPNPLMREMWVQARFPIQENDDGDDDDTDNNEFIVRGKIDRIDILQPSGNNNKVQLQIIDYKTGKKPNFKYSPKVNERIENEQFWKMKVYAVILWKMIQHSTRQANDGTRVYSELNKDSSNKKNDDYKYGLSWALQQRLMKVMSTDTNSPDWDNILELESLRLMYLTSHLDDASVNGDGDTSTESIGKATNLDYPLLGGSSTPEFEAILDQTESEVRHIASEIKRLVNIQDPLAFEHCDWRYCSCHELRQKFVRGSVYSSPE